MKNASRTQDYKNRRIQGEVFCTGKIHHTYVIIKPGFSSRNLSREIRSQKKKRKEDHGICASGGMTRGREFSANYLTRGARYLGI